MNYPESGKIKPSFLQRRYAIRLGRRYVSAAASVLLLGLIGYSKVTSTNAVVAQSLLSEQQSQITDS